MKVAALLVLAACGPTFLGERLPPVCRSSAQGCDAALRLRSWQDDYLAAPTKLDAYVTQVEARIARASTLDYVPEVVISPYGAAEVIGRTILIGRPSIMIVGSEAELAAILAHETAHLEAHTDQITMGFTIDQEAVADERGVVLLGRAGYPTHAMASALQRIIKPDDIDWNHPQPEVRRRRTTLAATDQRADDTRQAHLDHIAGEIVGRDLESGVQLGDAWVFADRGVVVRLPAGLTFETGQDHATAWSNWIHYGAWRLGPRTARDLISRMVVRAQLDLPIGHVTIGVAPPKSQRVAGSFERLIDNRRSSLAGIADDEIAAVIENAQGGMVVSLTGADRDEALLRSWLALLKPPTAAERAATVSPRLVYAHASKTAKVRELVAACIDPVAALELDDPDRVIAAGERVKCSDRKSPTAPVKDASPAPPSSPPTP